MMKKTWGGGDKDNSYEKHTLGPRRGTNQKHSLHHRKKKLRNQEQRQEGYANDANATIVRETPMRANLTKYAEQEMRNIHGVEAWKNERKLNGG